MEHRLELRMLQKLILTPQLQQAIKLLQLPQLELSQTLNNELVENPILEEMTEESLAEGAEAESEQPLSASEEEEEPAENPIDKLMDYNVDDYFNNQSYDGRDLGYFTPDIKPSQSIEHYVSEGTDLYDHLSWQLRLMETRATLRQVAEVVIGNIDDNGYLKATVGDIANYAECSEELAAEAISLVQSFDPTGVGAMNLKECLLLQLEPLGLKETLVESLIENNLKDLEKRNYKQIAQQHACSIEELMQAVSVLEGLEPKPGRGYSSTQPIYIKPDVYVIKVDDEFQIILNDENIPHIRINAYYKRLLAQKNSLQKDEKAYLEEKMRSAVWLLKSLDHRNKTIYRVTDSILKFQRDFFEKGVPGLRPLNLKDVAQELEMHESTISRATSNKYLSCSHGLFNFRFFFSSSIGSDNGAVSSTAVKDMIKKLINEEDASKPLSDQKISDMIKGFQIKIARRTVAKYREELHIPPQNIRKKMV